MTKSLSGRFFFYLHSLKLGNLSQTLASSDFSRLTSSGNLTPFFFILHKTCRKDIVKGDSVAEQGKRGLDVFVNRKCF